jgi:hypothetical protein
MAEFNSYIVLFYSAAGGKAFFFTEKKVQKSTFPHQLDLIILRPYQQKSSQKYFQLIF